MRKYVEPEVFEYCDGDSFVETVDRELALLVLKYAKAKQDACLTSQIDELQEAIDDDNE